jgi:hypothetical protein
MLSAFAWCIRRRLATTVLAFSDLTRALTIMYAAPSYCNTVPDAHAVQQQLQYLITQVLCKAANVHTLPLIEAGIVRQMNTM